MGAQIYPPGLPWSKDGRFFFHLIEGRSLDVCVHANELPKRRVDWRNIARCFPGFSGIPNENIKGIYHLVFPAMSVPTD